ncbi:hypothetical protein BC937DRAFT_86700 [Endogone sp. FLAS-F59071]|nr:hypothetical protein BC937DRAFT_86700 [Endogone sp. FLAS-F59071]|eukprot:RUS19929.1 hypothetical protein BC937DRAFT_86700 [Endogone sp. FLAS-F59071]
MGSSGSNQHDTTDDYIHRSSLISQVQDLFPDLGEGFIEACLIVNGDDAEAVTNQLLENALPKEVANLDRSLARAPMKSVSQGDVASVTIAVQDLTLGMVCVLAQGSLADFVEGRHLLMKGHHNVTGNDPLKNRRNIFDNDEFDVFTGKSLEKNKVNLGKKARGTANQLLDDKRFVQDNKQSIIESAYNIYDDEFDDTYDDIGSAGPLDLRFVDEYDDGESAPQRGVRQQQSDPGILHESDLVQMFINDPSVFERSATARRSPGRANLRKVTQMSDEQLEGWFIMFGRNVSHLCFSRASNKSWTSMHTSTSNLSCQAPKTTTSRLTTRKTARETGAKRRRSQQGHHNGVAAGRGGMTTGRRGQRHRSGLGRRRTNQGTRITTAKGVTIAKWRGQWVGQVRKEAVGIDLLID